MRADRTFATLVALALLSLALPVALAARLLPVALAAAAGGWAPHRAGVVGTACSRLFAILPGGAATMALLAGALLVASVVLSVRVAWRQWRAGARLSAAVRRARCRLPPSLVARLQGWGLADRVDLVEVTRPAAFTYGWWTPRVCLTAGLVALLGPDELAAVLRHERHHVARRDPLRLLWARALAAGAFFVPALRDVQTHGLTLLEVAADDAATAPPHGPSALARALYALLQHGAAETTSASVPPAGHLPRRGHVASDGADARTATDPLWSLDGGAVGFGPAPREVLDARIDHLLNPQQPLPVPWSPQRAVVTGALLTAAACLLLFL
jgi:hypothetical protein